VSLKPHVTFQGSNDTFVLVALLWAFVHGVRIAMHSVRTMGPLRALLRL
jgi:hypothetical protein